MTNHLILDSQLRFFAHHDLDETCLAIQNILGVTNGDIAGVVFSGFDWAGTSIEDHMVNLRVYLNTELRYTN